MIKISKLTDYAILVLSTLAQTQGQLLTTSALSVSTRIPEPTVAKVLKHLTKQGIVQSTRGVHGGYMMARDPARITVHELIVALEGPISITSCANNDSDQCIVKDYCTVRGGWQKINDTITAALDELFLTDLVSPYTPNQKQLRKEG